MPNTILYKIDDVTGCNCYQLNDELVGTCTDMLTCVCQPTPPVAGWSIESNNTTEETLVPTFYNPDGTLVTGQTIITGGSPATLSPPFDDGRVILHIDYEGYWEDEDCESDNDINSIAFIARLPQGQDISFPIDYYNLIYSYQGPDFTTNFWNIPPSIEVVNVNSFTNISADIYEIDIEGLIATPDSNGNYSIRYILALFNSSKDCVTLFPIEIGLPNHVTSIPTLLNLAQQPFAQYDTVNDLFEAGNLTIWHVEPTYPMSQVVMPSWNAIPAGTKILVDMFNNVSSGWAANLTKIKFLYNGTTHLGDNTFTGGSQKLDVVYYGIGLLAGYAGFELELLEDWQIGDSLKLQIDPTGTVSITDSNAGLAGTQFKVAYYLNDLAPIFQYYDIVNNVEIHHEVTVNII